MKKRKILSLTNCRGLLSWLKKVLHLVAFKTLKVNELKMLPGSLLLSFIVLIVGVSLGLFSFFNQDQPELCKAKSRLNYWFIDSDHSGDNSSLSTVKRVLGHLGHEAVNGSSEEWDVMWSIDFPFERFPQKLKNLKPHQIINHFPAITFLTNKM